MSTADVAVALARVKNVLQRSPGVGVHEDAPATAVWQSGTRVLTKHAIGTEISSDMPSELGGSGDRVTPGWLFRAGLAACAATSIALRAAQEGVELTALEVRATSQSDTRGLLGMYDADGTPVYAGPEHIQLHVNIAARGVPAQRLRDLVQEGCRCSPIPNAVRHAAELDLQIEAA
jgi:uncharacterized OsmC-like protein